MRLKQKYVSLAVSTLLMSSLALSPSALAQAKGYEVIDLGSLPFALSATAYDMNDHGHFVGLAYNVVDIPFRVEYLNPDNFSNIEDLNNLNSEEYLQVRSFLLARSTSLLNPEIQKITQYSGLWYKGVLTSLNDELDVIEPKTGQLTRSNDVVLYGINNKNEVVGEYRAPFLEVQGVNVNGEPTHYFERDRFPQALWSNGLIHKELPAAPGLTYQGTSRAYGINENNQVVGYAAIEETKTLLDSYATCTDPESVVAHLSVDSCMYRLWSHAFYTGSGLQNPLYKEAAYLWHLDDQGNVISQSSLGMAPTLLDDNEGKEDDKKVSGVVRSEALALNNQGVAVGFTSFISDQQYTLNYATLYQDNQATWIIPEGTQGYTQSKATHINDNGFIVGYANRVTLQYVRERMFVAHSDGREVLFPSGFFVDSSWRPHGINNNNQVVGRAERDLTQIQARRTVAFLYDIDTNTMTDLNSLLACNSGYDLFDAVSINDNGDIIALANVQDKRVVDGREYDGLTVQPVLVRANDSVQVCGDSSTQKERKGAAMGPIQFSIAAILALFAYGFRRRRSSL